MNEETPDFFREKHRPTFHFTPRENWLNDPNGLVYYDGLYHLFYQHNPYDKVWGAMHWGHATSRDLLHWEHRPVALHAEPEALGYIFSGSTVIDWNNTSGLQSGVHPPLVALFTHHSRHDVQVQSLAYSLNGGMNWRMHERNPVIANPGITDFRDPKVLWDVARSQWLMALAAGCRVEFYRSDNLFAWERVGEFQDGTGTDVWECPDLIPLWGQSGKEKWVLLLSQNPGAPNGGSGTRYFIGDFDGRCFRPEHREALWLDYGPDNYASVSWFNMPEGDGRCVIIGWMNNWNYANNLPTAPWRGAMTIPRELSLLDTPAGCRLAAAPVRELEALRVADWGAPATVPLSKAQAHIDLSGGCRLPPGLDIELEVDWSGPREPPCENWTLRFGNGAGEELLLTFHPETGQMTASRAKASAGLNQVAGFNREIVAPVELHGGARFGLRILKDTSSLEVFQDNGRSLLTLNYFCDAPLDNLDLTASRPVKITHLKIHALHSVWPSDGLKSAGT